jgi:hypothetical protein
MGAYLEVNKINRNGYHSIDFAAWRQQFPYDG